MFILFFARFALSFDKIGCGSEIKIKTLCFILYFAHLALSFDKIGCGSEIKIKTLSFILYFAHLALSLPLTMKMFHLKTF